MKLRRRSWGENEATPAWRARRARTARDRAWSVMERMVMAPPLFTGQNRGPGSRPPILEPALQGLGASAGGVG